MNWVALLQALLQVAVYVSKYVSDEHLMQAGEARLIRKQLELLNDKIKNADAARTQSDAHSDTGGLLDNDGYRRD